jgi:hypothetical protein
MTATNFYLVYIDESYDETHYAYSAMFVPVFQWNHYFDKLVKWRSEWFEAHKIPLDYELHATKFVGGRGEFPANRDKRYRALLFKEAIQKIENIDDGLKIINAITTDKKKHMMLFEYMLNRINTTLQYNKAYGVLICDEGNENKLTAVVRKMKKENHIPHQTSLYGYTNAPRNLPLQRIIEDPLFKTSKSSYFIQLSDFLAFSLLRNEKPLDGSTLEPVRTAFEQLDKTLVKVAFKSDPRKKGIIRV